MHNLSIIQEAWLANGAPMAGGPIRILGRNNLPIVIYPPEGNIPGYTVEASRFPFLWIETFPSFASALDFAADLATS